MSVSDRRHRARAVPAIVGPLALATFAMLSVTTPASSLQAQQGNSTAGPAPRAPMPIPAASAQASVELRLNGRQIAGRWFPTAAHLAGPGVIRLDYGQPHARGRTVMGSSLVPMDSVWRFGANLATHFTTDVDLELGGKHIPRGVYTLFALPTNSGWTLIVNSRTGQWGTDYDAAHDVARVALRTRTLAEPLESFTAWLIPTIQPQGEPPEPANGIMRFAWERVELSVDWRVAPAAP